jgi:hypothetical protein
MPERVFSKDTPKIDLGAFTLVPGVETRGLSTDLPTDAVPLIVDEADEEDEEEGEVEELEELEEVEEVEEVDNVDDEA